MSKQTTADEFLRAQLNPAVLAEAARKAAVFFWDFEVPKQPMNKVPNGNLSGLLDKYAELRIKEHIEEQKVKPETFLLEVKNVNCKFEMLRDKLEIICPSFSIDKDTFIYHAATDAVHLSIVRLAQHLKKRDLTIIPTKS